MYKKNKHLYLTSMVIINNTIVDIIATIFIKTRPALGADEFGEHLRTAPAIHGGVFQGASVRPDTQTTRIFVHLERFQYNLF